MDQKALKREDTVPEILQQEKGRNNIPENAEDTQFQCSNHLVGYPWHEDERGCDYWLPLFNR